jgi:polyhydroxyalkanoate synthesis repressor PhaR
MMHRKMAPNALKRKAGRHELRRWPMQRERAPGGLKQLAARSARRPRMRLPQRKIAVSAARKSAYSRGCRAPIQRSETYPPMSKQPTPITIKKYANRRLYNTASSAYVTLADLAKMVKGGEDFVVFDAKTNEDITRSVLAQIIFEQEGIQGQSLLPITFLRQIIRFYGDSVQALLPSYLEYSIDRFTGEQQKFREQASNAFGNNAFTGASFTALEELTRKNLAAFSQALGLFTPFANGAAASQNPSSPPPAQGNADLSELKAQLSEMQRRLDTISEKS